MSARDRFVSASLLLYMRRFDELSMIERRINDDPDALGLPPRKISELRCVIDEAKAGAFELIQRVLHDAIKAGLSKHFIVKVPKTWSSSAREFWSGTVRLTRRGPGRKFTRCGMCFDLEERRLTLYLWFQPSYFSQRTAEFTESIAKRAKLAKSVREERAGRYLELPIPLAEGMSFDAVVATMQKCLGRVILGQRRRILTVKL